MSRKRTLLIKRTVLRACSWIFALMVVAFPSASFAGFEQINDLSKCQTIPCCEISGTITKSDLKELNHFINQMNESNRTSLIVRLDSVGGNLEVAIAIGRQLRKHRASIFTWNNGKCYSSCVFVLAGGVRRYLSSNIGIHRPFPESSDKLDYQTIQSNQRRLSKFAKKYLKEVNVSPSLYDAMMSIPSDKIKILSEHELEFYGIVEVDPVEQEFQNATEARRLGLSMTEFIQKKGLVNTNCAEAYNNGSRTGDFDSYVACRDAILNSKESETTMEPNHSN